jgi:hypothetical protein
MASFFPYNKITMKNRVLLPFPTGKLPTQADEIARLKDKT